MTNQEAFYIIGNIPIPTDDKSYDICQYQEAKAIALDCIQKVDDSEDEKKKIRADAIDELIDKLPYSALIRMSTIRKVAEQLKEKK